MLILNLVAKVVKSIPPPSTGNPRLNCDDDALYFVDSGWRYYVGMHLPVLQLGYCSL